MSNTQVAVIGAGQAGLAVSRLLTDSGVEHVVLERGRIAERWRSQRWDSLRLLTPNWMTRLPGWSYCGADPAGFMPAGTVAGFLDAYARSFGAPIVHGADVCCVDRADAGYRVVSTAGSWSVDAVVIATGACDRPAVPDIAGHLHPCVAQLTPDRYRNPDSIPPGGVLVVGASATGVQLADELASAGRDVVLSVGRHTRVPRRYRGLDIMWWLDAVGVLHRPREAARRRREPSLQLLGAAERPVDLPALADRGVRLAGRLTAVHGRTLRFAELAATAGEADRSLSGLLRRLDTFALTTGLDAELDRPNQPRCSAGLADRALHRLDLADVMSVIWATGFRREYPWLRVPVLDAGGEIRQINGRTPAPGLFVIGLPGQTRRSSTLLDGVRFDAELVVDAVLEDIAGRRTTRRASCPATGMRSVSGPLRPAGVGPDLSPLHTQRGRARAPACDHQSCTPSGPQY